MRQIIAVEYLSLDGVMSDPAWTAPYFNDELGALQNKWLLESDALLLGRVTYEGMSQAWMANRDGDSFTERINALPKRVVSNTLTSLTWNATPLGGDVSAEVRALKHGEDGNMLTYGSGQLVRALLGQQLIDALHLIVCPVVVGQGQRLFDEESRAALRLAGVQTTATGVAVLSYQPEHANGG